MVTVWQNYMIQVLIADDHAIVRGGIRQILSLSGDISVVAEATDGSEVMALLRQQSCDLLLMDMTMPGICGIDLISRIRSHWPELPVLVLSMHNEAQIATRALRSGASGYITKDSDPEKLLQAIRKVAGGGRYIDPVLAEQIIFNNSDNERSPHTLLSDREFEIFNLLVAGLGVNDIAERLVISNKTVSTHKTRMMKKMQAGSVADLVRYAVEHHLIP